MTIHCIALHYNKFLHYIAFHYINIQYTTLHYITYITLHYIQCIALITIGTQAITLSGPTYRPAEAVGPVEVASALGLAVHLRKGRLRPRAAGASGRRFVFLPLLGCWNDPPAKSFFVLTFWGFGGKPLDLPKVCFFLLDR